MRTAKEIRKYLKQQHWYKEYVRNLKFKHLYILFIRGYQGSCTISSAFVWIDTPEGHTVWSRRNLLFLRWYYRGRRTEV